MKTHRKAEHSRTRVDAIEVTFGYAPNARWFKTRRRAFSHAKHVSNLGGVSQVCSYYGRRWAPVVFVDRDGRQSKI
jgi:hypothetical protein